MPVLLLIDCQALVDRKANDYNRVQRARGGIPPSVWSVALVSDGPAYDRIQRWPKPLNRYMERRPRRRRFPLSSQRFQIGVLTVVTLVALRLALGCHFLYEGVWKIKHRDEFTAEPFLTQAKGPISGLFYAMVPDIDGRQRLQIETDAGGRKSINSDAIAARWNAIRQDFVDYYRLASSADDAAQSDQKELERKAERTCNDFREKLENYFRANLDDIVAHFDALDRFQSDKERYQQAPFQKQRRWDRMMELRREGDKWINDIEAQEQVFLNSLYGLLDTQQQEQGRMPASWNPFRWNRMEQINFAVTYGLTAIGVCLMLGFCTPLAALGGAAFMCFVVMTQPAFPGIYPPDPPVVGHALLVNKDFIEMLALLTIAAASAGRWGGLDYFLYHFIINPFFARKIQKEQ